MGQVVLIHETKLSGKLTIFCHECAPHPNSSIHQEIAHAVLPKHWKVKIKEANCIIRFINQNAIEKVFVTQVSNGFLEWIYLDNFAPSQAYSSFLQKV
jgi:hypothetical protein